MNNEIRNLTEETIFNLYKKDYPKIVEFVKAGLSTGETPKTIWKFLQGKLGKSSATAAHISLVASYLVRCPNGA